MPDKKDKCWNCKHASSRYEIADKTHYNCLHPKHEEGLKSGELSPWDMLKDWYDTCESHEKKIKVELMGSSQLNQSLLKNESKTF